VERETDRTSGVSDDGFFAGNGRTIVSANGARALTRDCINAIAFDPEKIYLIG